MQWQDLSSQPQTPDSLQRFARTAAQLAAVVQQHWAEPAQQAQHRLALAQVAAARSCAYLRCPNVEQAGGPAAGEGLSSKLCRCVWIVQHARKLALSSSRSATSPAEPSHTRHCQPCYPMCPLAFPPTRSACRAVWYCSTACSHADWRQGGHRRVCRALGEVRRQAKERQAAAASAAAAAVQHG